MNLSQLFAPVFNERCNSPAIEFQGLSLTFGEIDERANRMARVLRARGLGPGDRLCIYVTNRLAVIDLFLACVRTGVIFVPINILYRDREILHIVKDSEASAIVAADQLSAGVPVWSPDELTNETEGQDVSPLDAPLDGDDPAAIVYTSGTTGISKGAVLSHNNFAINAVNIVTCWRITSSDRFLLALPLFHVHGLGNGVHAWLLSGCFTRLLERFDHSKAVETFLDFRPTLFFGVPTMYVRLLETAPDAARAVGAGMRLFVSGSAPLSAQVLEEFAGLFGHTILERYGMTETLMNMSNPYTGDRRAGTVGLPLPGASVKLLDEQGKPVANGEMGEVHLRGPNVFAGYWRNPEATAAAFRDGWFRTGDLATRSTDGYFTLQGRRSDVIISAGFNVYPREVEEAILEDPAIAEAAVAGVPDHLRGEVPVAYIVPRGEADLAALEARLRERLASFKVPRAFVRVDKLPRTALGKVQKHLLPRVNAG